MKEHWLTAKEAAAQWGIQVRQVQSLCAVGKITGVMRLGKQWLIPLDAPKPQDGRSRGETAAAGALPLAAPPLPAASLYTENELFNYFEQEKLAATPQTLRDIIHDTGGWPPAVDFIVRALPRAPGYKGYVRNAMFNHVFALFERETWCQATVDVQRFWLRLSLTGHLAGSLVFELAKENEPLLADALASCEQFYFDSLSGAYQMRPLFRAFLHSRQDVLTKGEKTGTYGTVAAWCMRHEYYADAVCYHAKANDYAALLHMLADFPTILAADVARAVYKNLAAAPLDSFSKLKHFAGRHVQAAISLGRFDEATRLFKTYEKMLPEVPGEEEFRREELSFLQQMGMVAGFLCQCFESEEREAFFQNGPKAHSSIPYPLGVWVSMVGSSQAGSARAYCALLTDLVGQPSSLSFPLGHWPGIPELCLGELHFYQADFAKAELFFAHALEAAKKHGQTATAEKALFYTLRITAARGNPAAAAQTLADIEGMTGEENDLARAWYYAYLREPALIPAWLKSAFVAFRHANFHENHENQLRARCHYLEKKYLPLLSYINEALERETLLYGRVEMLALKAGVHMQMGEKDKAFHALRQAYENAWQNEITLPFIELGKDMRTLAAHALAQNGHDIPPAWLADVKRRASSYAKKQSYMIAAHKKARGEGDHKELSFREREVLADLQRGLSRAEIAATQNLAIGTVNTVINNICAKLSAHNVIEVVRIAYERGYRV